MRRPMTIQHHGIFEPAQKPPRTLILLAINAISLIFYFIDLTKYKASFGIPKCSTKDHVLLFQLRLTPISTILPTSLPIVANKEHLKEKAQQEKRAHNTRPYIRILLVYIPNSETIRAYTSYPTYRPTTAPDIKVSPSPSPPLQNKNKASESIDLPQYPARYPKPMLTAKVSYDLMALVLRDNRSYSSYLFRQSNVSRQFILQIFLQSRHNWITQRSFSTALLTRIKSISLLSYIYQSVLQKARN